ncbi:MULTISPECIES: glycine cleavage system protein GcvH [Methylomonas]|uniref:Glycine cleavage system H protein n=1 Tax=Methylomonas koyamae TaxID=702114 RepID=A0AA91I4Z3_9GAMM|nr:MULTISPECIES: glycine cleavage system protein GcvH [Methylomonas]ANE57017.1 glycine cleavage system protein H [Methylomonas sp. DH-1]OAI25484.1 glycine cleavage system protein H [Methylomonas koyamae]BBL60214.1 glycine cleavage system H protein 2 [Methylomonas koyamae]
MTEAPENLKYAQTHEWAKLEDGGLVRVGITDFAQSELGDIVFIGLPEVGRAVKAQEQLAVVESVKTASDLFSPVSGSVVAVNEAVQDAPELVNEDAYQTWLFCIQADDPAELDQLLDAQGYQNLIEA